jgi:hypothetical protein
VVEEESHVAGHDGGARPIVAAIRLMLDKPVAYIVLNVLLDGMAFSACGWKGVLTRNRVVHCVIYCQIGYLVISSEMMRPCADAHTIRQLLCLLEKPLEPRVPRRFVSIAGR